MRRVLPSVPAVLLALHLCATGCVAEGGDGDVRAEKQETAGEVRQAVWAGPNSFYPSDPEILARDIDGYLASAGTRELDGGIVALICPHAIGIRLLRLQQRRNAIERIGE